MTKSQIREQLRQRRASLNDEYRSLANQQLIQNITSSALWQQAQTVAIYLAFGDEADISSLLTTDKSIFLPSIKSNDMQFQLYDERINFETLSYGLKQPRYLDDLPAADIDLILMPLVGFDMSGNRLGMGGGYYDRYFAKVKTGIRAGVAYHCQQVEQLPCDPWDVRIQHIFTEQQYIKI
jgi:5-formyltetrahydrofolate cyclo-ligase